VQDIFPCNSGKVAPCLSHKAIGESTTKKWAHYYFADGYAPCLRHSPYAAVLCTTGVNPQLQNVSNLRRFAFIGVVQKNAFCAKQDNF
jgi:hypothetical protein